MPHGAEPVEGTSVGGCGYYHGWQSKVEQPAGGIESPHPHLRGPWGGWGVGRGCRILGTCLPFCFLRSVNAYNHPEGRGPVTPTLQMGKWRLREVE